MWSTEQLASLVIKQLNNFFEVSVGDDFEKHIGIAQKRLLQSASELCSKDSGDMNPYHTVQWSLFLYYLSNSIGNTGGGGYLPIKFII